MSAYRLLFDWQGLSMVVGINLQRDVYFQDGNLLLRRSGYAVWNAGVGYRLTEHWDLSLIVNNLFDKHLLRALEFKPSTTTSMESLEFISS